MHVLIVFFSPSTQAYNRPASGDRLSSRQSEIFSHTVFMNGDDRPPIEYFIRSSYNSRVIIYVRVLSPVLIARSLRRRPTVTTEPLRAAGRAVGDAVGRVKNARRQPTKSPFSTVVNRMRYVAVVPCDVFLLIVVSCYRGITLVRPVVTRRKL